MESFSRKYEKQLADLQALEKVKAAAEALSPKDLKSTNLAGNPKLKTQAGSPDSKTKKE